MKVSTNAASSSRNDDNPAPTVSSCSSSSVSNQSSYPNLNNAFVEDINFEVKFNDKLSENLTQYLTNDLEKVSSLQNTT